MADEEDGPDLPRDEPIEIPLSDVLDLHGFPPRDVAQIVRDYLDDASRAGFRALRIVHGRGIGVQRETVRAILAHDPRVAAFRDAPGEHGGWGATIVELR
ncbi:MAG: Smr/MutS family protein [Thermoanaerobaculia bacterium]|nr:MAG: Smr/MutS family protein [Thermoanaerobaculia bacterium]